jgi:hypothetical protein
MPYLLSQRSTEGLQVWGVLSYRSYYVSPRGDRTKSSTPTPCHLVPDHRSEAVGGGATVFIRWAEFLLHMDLILREQYWIKFCMKLITVILHDNY